MTTKVELFDPKIPSLEMELAEPTYKLTTYKTVKDIDGKDVQVVDFTETVTIKNLQAEKDALLSRIAVLDLKLGEIGKLSEPKEV